LKAKKEDKVIGKLFRDNLEKADVMPSPDVNVMLMKRLRRREFLHFIPDRFNIWYAGIIAAAAGVLTVLLVSGKDEIVKPDPFAIEKVIDILVPDVENHNTIKYLEGNYQSESDDMQKSEDTKLSPDTGKDYADNIKAGGDGTEPGVVKNNPGQVMTGRLTPSVAITGDNEKDVLKGGTIETAGLIDAFPLSGCAPLKVRFSTIAGRSDSCIWYFGDGGMSKNINPEWIFDDEGNYNVTLNLFRGGMKMVSSVNLEVYSSPEARFEIISGHDIEAGKLMFRNYSRGASAYKWNFGDGNYSEQTDPLHSYDHSGQYRITLVATSEQGCTDTVQVIYDAGKNPWFIDFPNAFIPNINGPSGGYYSSSTDEQARVFHPSYSGIASYQLRIYTRLGILLFESNDIEIGWDGYYKGQLCDPGVYIWKVKGTFLNGESYTMMGDVTLIKEF